MRDKTFHISVNVIMRYVWHCFPMHTYWNRNDINILHCVYCKMAQWQTRLHPVMKMLLKGRHSCLNAGYFILPETSVLYVVDWSGRFSVTADGVDVFPNTNLHEEEFTYLDYVNIDLGKYGETDETGSFSEWCIARTPGEISLECKGK